MDRLYLSDVAALRPGLNHTVIDDTATGLRPGFMLPTCLDQKELPQTSVVIAEVEGIRWDEIPVEYFSRYHYRSLTKDHARRALALAYPEGWGPEVTWLWFVVCGWGSGSA